jgi:ribosomal protein S18 acetylase RimI-like enzyme
VSDLRTEVVFEGYDGPTAQGLLDVVRPVYGEVYAESPYCEGEAEVEGFAKGWERLVAAPGFRLVLARSAEEVVGFTFGYTLAPDTRWWAGALTQLSEHVTREYPGRTFAIIELAVRKPFRRRGIARELHRRLLEGGTAERVTLLVRPEPEAAAAWTAYATWGYAKVGQVRPGPDLPVYDAMVRPLPFEARRSAPPF